MILRKRTIFSMLLTAAVLVEATIAPVAAATPASASATCVTANVGANVPGFSGHYFNLSESDPGMRAAADKEQPASDQKIGGDNYWYTAPYFAFSRIDSNLRFGGFTPVNTGKPGDPYQFAVHWRARMEVPSNGNYQLSLLSDDDSWLFVDNTLVVDNGGFHRAQVRSATPTLTGGSHIVDIYYADRAPAQAIFMFTPDGRLSFFAVPLPCPTGNGGVPETAVSGTGTQTGSPSTPSGRVLGASYLPYTPAIALYKTASSPAVYAIFANGERHYISSPESFKKYGYKFSNIKVVTQQTLDRYPEARLLRTPEDATVFFLSSRPNHQWLKISIATPTVFVSYDHNEWGNVIVIDDLDLRTYPNTNLVRTKTDATIYLLQSNQRRAFLSNSIMETLGYNQGEVLQISDTHLQSFALGEPVG